MRLPIRMPTLPIRRRFVLLIGDDGVLLVSAGKRGDPLRLFATSIDDEAGVAAIREALYAEPKTPLCVLIDTLDQSYRSEGLPRVNPLDQAKVVRRRLEMTFPGGNLRGARRLRDDAERRTQKQYMFVAVGDTPHLQAWLRFVEAVPNPLLRVGTLPLESAGLVGRIQQIDPESAGPRTWYALVTWQRTGGFRQIIVHQGHLAFTRLTPGLEDPASPALIAGTLERDLRSSLGYLTRLGFKEGDLLRLVIVAPQETHATLAALRIAGEAPTAVTPQAFGARMGLRIRADDRFGDELHAAWFAQAPITTLQIMPRKLNERRLVDEAAAWSLRAGVAALAGAGLYGTLLFVQTLLDEQAFAEREPQLAGAVQRVRAAEEALGIFSIPVGTVRGTIELKEMLQRNDVHPWSMLLAVTRSLSPEERLDHLDWRPYEAQPGTGQQAGQGTRQDGPPPMETLLSVRFEETVPRNEVVERTDALRDRIAALLQDQLVEVARYPIAIERNQTLTGGGIVLTPTSQDEVAASFTAQLTIRSGPS